MTKREKCCYYKVGKDCVLDKSRKIITEFVKNIYMGSFITEGIFYFFDDLK